MSRDSSPHLNPSDETIKAGQVTIRFLVMGKDSNGSVAVFELKMPAGERLTAPAQRVITFTVDGVPIDIGPGQAKCIPRGTVHRYDNNGSNDVKGFCAVTRRTLAPSSFVKLRRFTLRRRRGRPTASGSWT